MTWDCAGRGEISGLFLFLFVRTIVLGEDEL